MSRSRLFVICAAGAVALGMATGFGPSAAGSGTAWGSPPLGCPAVGARTVSLGSSSARAGAVVWAAAAGRLVGVEGSASTVAAAGSADDVMIRHVASVDGVGTAFVEDGRGGDTVVLVTPQGVERLPQRTEALNPALSTSGDLAWSTGSQIRVRDGGSGRIQRLPVPVNGASAFSPVFVGSGALDVVLSSPPTPAVPEGEWLNEIWRVSTQGTWRRTTDFRADDDRWTAIRTPVAAPAGGIEFILVRGRGSATQEPRFALMHLGRSGLDRLRILDREMYLAGFGGGMRLWNVPDAARLRVDLVREEPDGSTETIGCGTTLMDPVDVADPDRAPIARASEPQGSGSTDAQRPEPGSVAAASEIGILVGDFATTGEADAAMAAVRAAYGPDAPVRLVTSETAPHALRPGAVGVLLPLSAGDDPVSALAAFRVKMPLYASMTWVVAA